MSEEWLELESSIDPLPEKWIGGYAFDYTTYKIRDEPKKIIKNTFTQV